MTNPNKPFKVLLVGDCLAGGGAEKVHSLLSIYFKQSGLEVHNCIFVDWVSYDYAGSLLNLGKVSPNSFFIFRKIKRIFVLKKTIDTHDFDAVIDFRMRTTFVLEWLLSTWIYPKNTFYTVRSGILEFYFPKSDFLARLLYKKRTIVTVSKGIRDLISDKKLSDNVTFIYNPTVFESVDLLKNQYDVAADNFIMAAGRMNDEVKQFDKLILAYSKSILPQHQIRLLILGSGQYQQKYKELAAQLGLQELVQFEGYKENPFPYYKKALFSVLSSKNEGFPNVLTEALATGIPAVAFDCFSGPGEIIIDRENGILVENQNLEKLTQAMNLFVEDKALYEHCRQNAKQSIGRFDMEIIGKQWLELVKNTVS